MRLQVANCCYHLGITTFQNLLLCQVSCILIVRRDRSNFCIQHHLDIGRDAEIAYEMSFGSQPFTGTEENGRAVGERKFLKYGPCTERLLAHDDAPVVILQRARDYFGCAGSIVIDQHDDGDACVDRISVYRVGSTLPLAVLLQQDVPMGNEFADRIDCFLEIAAWFRVVLSWSDTPLANCTI